MPSNTTETYEFGEFRLDVKEHRLERIDGSRDHTLPEKAFQTLTFLVRRSGSLVTKEELIANVWPDTIVEENNLDKAIHTIRNALRDRPPEAKYIETVRKHGYRFVAEVRRVGQDNVDAGLKVYESGEPLDAGADFPDGRISMSGAHAILSLDEWNSVQERLNPDGETNSNGTEPTWAPGEPTFESRATAEPGNGRLVFTAAAGILLVACSVAVYLFLFNREGDGHPAKRQLLVLPVRSIDSQSRDEVMEMGIADSLIRQLSAENGLIVRPLSATRKYSESPKEPQLAGQEQKVDFVVEANYQTVDGRTRVTGRLIDASSGIAVDSFKFETAVPDHFAIQDAAAASISERIFSSLGIDSKRSPAERGTGSEEAYRLYLQAKYLYGKRNLQASKMAVELLDEAVRIDPNYAIAWALKAHAHRYAGNLGRDTDTHAEYQKSISSIERALALDDKVSEAYSALCENKLYYEFDFAGAEANCRKALELDPNSSLAHEVYGRFLTHRGRFDEGIAEIKRAIDLDPTSLFNQRNLGIALYYSGKYNDAEGQFKRVLAMDESFISAYMWLRNAFEIQGKFDEAFACLIRAQRAAGADEKTIKIYEAAFKTGGYPELLREHAKFHETYNQFYVSAILSAQIGEKESAFKYLDISYQRREWGLNSLLIEPHLKSLQSDPRFGQLVDKIGLNKN